MYQEMTFVMKTKFHLPFYIPLIAETAQKNSNCHHYKRKQDLQFGNDEKQSLRKVFKTTTIN
jgi:hypothetical protein